MSRTDKSTSTPSTPTTPIPPNVTKLCHIIKRPDFDGYGFNLHSEKVKPGQFIGKVDPKSPAEEAGLKEGDRIIEVNGVPIGTETHKQVVQRIKAISCEVRLLLIDVDGKGDAPKTPNSAKPIQVMDSKPTTPTTPPPAMLATNGTPEREHAEYHGTKLELPGESANISSISMVSTKRMSSTSASSSNHSSSDVVDRGTMGDNHAGNMHNGNGMLMMPMPDLTNGIEDKQQHYDKSMPNNNNNNNINNINNNMMAMTITTPTTPPPATATAAVVAAPTMPEQSMTVNVPPPPSAITATNANNNNNNNSSSNMLPTVNANGNGNGIGIGIVAATMPMSATANTTTTTAAPVTTNNNSGVIRAGSLNLPMTAAEMRAKLMSKKKYDPKSESVDLKKKFEIIQKL